MPSNASHIGIAQPRCRLSQGVENRLQIVGRTADDLEHIGGRRLLLVSLAQLAPESVELILRFGKGGSATARCRGGLRVRLRMSRFSTRGLC